jgi:hypothetical protein
MGRDKRNEYKAEHYTKMIRSHMETPAWRALSPTAQALYPWVKFEWKGPKNNNNGKIGLSVRQAADRLGVNIKTAARAFHDLQAKGFLVVTRPASLGLHGEAKSPCFEITEIPLPHSDHNEGRKLFRQWKDGQDFPVQKAAIHNPRGHTRNTLSPKTARTCSKNGNV